MSGKVKEAKVFVELALEIDENYIGALNNKVTISIIEEDLKDALEIIEKAIKIDDKNKEI